ncbi:MAG: PD40 domain-containing protein, partial [Actinomyces graevenitzii]|nr:PD40 domain-containing protein [Actinomyces graevenitzii]
PDGRRIVASSVGDAQVWDAVTGKELLSLERGRGVESVSWSPDGRRIATGSDNGVWVWDAVTGKGLLSLERGRGARSVAWSPDGRRIATGSDDGDFWVWDAVTGENVLSLKHDHQVELVAWSPDGKRILTKTRRNEIRIWDVTSGEQASFFITPLPEGERVVLSADQTKVIGASAGAWRWLGRLAVLPDGKLERMPVEIDGPLPPLGPDAEVE